MLPDIGPGCEGVGVTLTVNVLGELLPQLTLAVTKIAPPELPAVAEMDVDVEVPDQPDGKVQV